MSALIVPELGIPAIGTHAWESLWRRLEHALASAEAPDLVLPTVDGEEFRLSSLRGQKVVIVSWAPY